MDRQRTRKGARPRYNPIRERAKVVADELFERAMKVAQWSSPDAPDDQEALPDDQLWGFLELVAVELSPAYWDDPDALDELYRLRGEFAPDAPRDDLPPLAKAARVAQRNRPDVSITPANPDYERMVQRVTTG